MKVVLTRGLWIDNKLYPAGQQDISEDALKGKTFSKHIKAGHVVEASTVRKTAVKTQADRAEALLEKLHSKHVKDATPEQAEKLKGGVKSADASVEPDFGDTNVPEVKTKKR